MEGLGIVEQHHRPLGRHEDVAGAVVQAPDLHVGDVGGVADVHRVVEQAAHQVAPGQLGAQPPQPIPPDDAEIRLGQARRRPLGDGGVGGADIGKLGPDRVAHPDRRDLASVAAKIAGEHGHGSPAALEWVAGHLAGQPGRRQRCAASVKSTNDRLTDPISTATVKNPPPRSGFRRRRPSGGPAAPPAPGPNTSWRRRAESPRPPPRRPRGRHRRARASATMADR